MARRQLRRRRLPRSAWLVLVPVISLAAGAAVGVTRAAFSAQTSSSANSLSAAACFSASPSPTWLTGMEHGTVSTSGAGIFNTVQNTGAVTADTVVTRSGSYSLKLAPAGSATNATRTLSAVPVVVARFGLRLNTLPGGNVQLATVATNTGETLILSYNSGTQKLNLGFTSGGSVASLAAVSAATWYVIDLRLNVTTNPLTADWQIGGVAQTSTSWATAGGNVSTFRWGTQNGETYTAHIDDMFLSHTSADYPVGDGSIHAAAPDSTAFPVTNFEDNDGSALDSTSWQRIDDVPMTSTADYIMQTNNSSTSYVQVNFPDASANCIRGVSAWLAYQTSFALFGANDGKTSVFDGSTERIVYSGDMYDTSLVYKSAVIAPASSPWTQSTFNALTARIGYSTDVNPTPRWHALRLEYETAP